MKIALLDISTLGDDISLSSFDSMGDVRKYPMTAPGQVTDRISDVDVIVANKVKLSADVLCCAKNLKLICVTATGYDNVDTEYCKKNNIAVCNVTAYSTDSVMQLTVSMALSLTMHLKEFDSYTKSGDYTKSGVQNYLKPTFGELSSMTWGIVGLGNIGKRVAEVAKVLGADVIAYKRTPVADYKCVDIDTLCKKADIISIHTPLNEETENLINKERIALMKKNAVLINVARGKVADEAALTEAVLENRIGGLGIDVYSAEPMQEDSPYNKLIDKDNVILTPHMAWGAYEARIRCMDEVKKNIEAFFSGEKRNRIC